MILALTLQSNQGYVSSPNITKQSKGMILALTLQSNHGHDSSPNITKQSSYDASPNIT